MSAETQAAPDLKAVEALMRENRFDAALAALEPATRADGDAAADALYLSAVCLRYLGRLDDAARTIFETLDRAPDFARALQEQGHIHKAAGRMPEALASYRAAVRSHPGLHAAWAGQAEIFSAAGQTAAAADAQRRTEALRALAPPLLAATNHLYENRLNKAEDLVRAWLQKYPRDVAAMRLLAEIGQRLGVLEDAEFLLESAREFAPDNADLHIEHVQILRKRQKHARALAEADALYARDPGNPLFISQLAVARMQLGDFDGAIALFDEVLATAPGDPVTLTSKGHALKTQGHTDAAIEAYRAALAADPAHGDAWYALANLKTYSFSPDDRAELAAREAAPGQTLANRINLCFALAKAHEDAGETEAAFSAYERGNALKKRQTRYTSEQMAAEFEAQKTLCTPALFTAQGGKGHDDPAPIFIVGLPRAGSTLLEQILASHSQVDGTLELPNILALSQKLRGRQRSNPRYPAVLAELSAEQLQDHGRRYIEDTAVHRQGAPFFTDKMPNNFRHIGLIKLILPNAKIIDARRHPLDCCVSGFKQLFAEGQEFTYGLDEIGRYYRGYVDLMDHWDAVLPGEILRVIHEDVVGDLDGQVRRLLDFLGLPFEQASVEFHKTEREVRTASAQQVREPINTRGLEQWRKFEAHLDPLKAALGPVLDDWRRDTASGAA